MDLFKESNEAIPPLAYRVRPKTLNEFVGQSKELSHGRPLRKMIESGNLHSFLIYGPPGTGKTTIAQIASAGMRTVSFSATTEHIKDVKKSLENLIKETSFSQITPIIIVDEMQHFTRREQDAFLDYVEKGEIILIALTTENPSFYVNSALLSRLSIFFFEKLKDEEIVQIIKNALLNDEYIKGREISEEALKYIVEQSDGDGRKALNIVESILTSIDKQTIEYRDIELFQDKVLIYGKELHYDLISAFIKSMRGSDPNAATYYMYRMIKAGEDPLYIARRMIRFAAEDIGITDPMALVIANAAMNSFNFVGAPEGYLVLLEACVYLANAPKSNELYLAEKDAIETIDSTGSLEIPRKLLNPVTKLMKEMGYGKDYKYPHNYEGSIVKGETYLPEEIKDKKFFRQK
ncbi:MAG: replication-associated recombination protein A [Caldisericaceae bacterium]